MSGIAATFARNGSVREADFDAVFDALDHRGWDGADAVVRDRVALGHHHAYTTPEAVGERQPVSLDDLWVAMDGRVDNRAELFEGLADAGAPASTDVSDAELVLRAYRAWGDGFLDRSVGAFALALWDPADERLLVARDKTGIHKVYYADGGDVVVVASEMAAVLEHPAVPDDVNEGFVGEFLSRTTVTRGETFYEAVRTVEPGAAVTVTAEATRPERYWTPWDADVDLDGSTDVVATARDGLQEAVACRLRGRELPGVMLSGGLDSTTIACLAKRHLDRTGRGDVALDAFSMVVDGVDFFGDEVDRLDAVVEHCGAESHRIRADEYFTLKDVDLYEAAARESPAVGPLAASNRRLYETAAAAGRNVLLAGFGGNMYDGSRFYYLDLLRRGRLGCFVRQAWSDPMPVRRLLLWYVLVPSSDRVTELVRRWYDHDTVEEVPPWLAAEFVERSGLADRLATDVETGFATPSRELMYKRFFGTPREFRDAVERQHALRAGVDLRVPFLDSRLLAVLFSVPPWETFDAGEDKVLVRRAMRGILPEVVRTQDAAVHFDPLVEAGVRDRRRAYVRDLLADPLLADRGVVDEEAFDAHVEAALDGDVNLSEFWEQVATELWLGHWA